MREAFVHKGNFICVRSVVILVIFFVSINKRSKVGPVFLRPDQCLLRAETSPVCSCKTFMVMVVFWVHP